MEHNIGDVIAFKPEHVPVIEQLLEREREAHTAYVAATRLMVDANDKTWDTIRELFPELVNFQIFLTSDKPTQLRIVGTKKEKL